MSESTASRAEILRAIDDGHQRIADHIETIRTLQTSVMGLVEINRQRIAKLLKAEELPR
jgi:hypothetical protein